MKVLGILFDNKLDWSPHINEVLNKTLKIQYGLRCLKKYFTTPELLNLVTSLGMSRLYYGSAAWLSRSLTDFNHRKLMRASSGLIKACLDSSDWSLVSFLDLHQLSGKATPLMMSDYFQAMELKKIVEYSSPSLVWSRLQLNCRLNQRSGSMVFGNGSRNPFGKLNFGNRVEHVSRQLPIGWENMSMSLYKKTCKRLFLTS